MRNQRPQRGRLSSPTTWVALLAGGAVAGAIALAMAPANAEASSTTATLTLTGLVDSNCQVSTGGTTAHVAPGGTVTIKASLAGASIQLPLAGTIPLDSGKVASFVDRVKIDGHKHTLKTSKDKIVLNNVSGSHKISWSATAVSLLGGLGTVPLNGNNVNLPAGGKLSWSGKIVASKNTDCGIAIQTPKVKASAASHTVTLPGVKVSVPNPVPSVLKKLPKPGLPSLPGVGSSSGAKGSKGGKQTGPTVKYTPPATTVPEKVMPRAVNMGGGGGGGFAPPALGGGGAAPAVQPVTATAAGSTPKPTPAAKIKPARTVELAQHDQLGGAQLPVLLALAAIIALSTVTAMYARMYLLRRTK